MHHLKGKWYQALFIIIFSGLLINTAFAGSKTFIAGNDSGKNNDNGPNGDGSASLTYALGSGSSLVFYKTTSSTPIPANVKLKYSGIDTGHAVGGTGFIYCTYHNNASGEKMQLTNAMVSANKTYGGHNLFKTNITGLYYNINISNMYTDRATISAAAQITYIGDSSSVPLTIIDTNNLCDDETGRSITSPTYQSYGGIVSDMEIEFFTDNTFSPTNGSTIELLTSSPNYLLKYHTGGAGSKIATTSMFIKFSLTSVTITNPTCFTSILSGTSVVNGNEVQLGSYSPQSIKEGAADVPFAIELQNCIRVKNIEVKLKTNKLGKDVTLLGNTLTGNTAASGVSVQIQGEQTTKSSKMVLKPNDSASIYKDYEDETDTSNGIFGGGAEGSATSQTLHFLATLKQDSSQTIMPGQFKATGVFSITYP